MIRYRSFLLLYEFKFIFQFNQVSNDILFVACDIGEAFGLSNFWIRLYHYMQLWIQSVFH